MSYTITLLSHDNGTLFTLLPSPGQWLQEEIREGVSEGTKQNSHMHAHGRVGTTRQGALTFFRWKGIALLRLGLLQLASVELSNVVKHLTLVSHGFDSLLGRAANATQDITHCGITSPVSAEYSPFVILRFLKCTMEKTVPPAGVRDR